MPQGRFSWFLVMLVVATRTVLLGNLSLYFVLFPGL